MVSRSVRHKTAPKRRPHGNERSGKRHQQEQAHPDVSSACVLEVLDRALMTLGRRPRRERPEIPPAAGVRILLSRVKTVLARLQFANHDRALWSGPLRDLENAIGRQQVKLATKILAE